MEKECEEKKILEQEAAEEIRDVQVECVNGGHGEVLKEDTNSMKALGSKLSAITVNLKRTRIL